VCVGEVDHSLPQHTYNTNTHSHTHMRRQRAHTTRTPSRTTTQIDSRCGHQSCCYSAISRRTIRLARRTRTSRSKRTTLGARFFGAHTSPAGTVEQPSECTNVTLSHGTRTHIHTHLHKGGKEHGYVNACRYQQRQACHDAAWQSRSSACYPHALKVVPVHGTRQHQQNSVTASLW